MAATDQPLPIRTIRIHIPLLLPRIYLLNKHHIHKASSLIWCAELIIDPLQQYHVEKTSDAYNKYGSVYQLLPEYAVGCSISGSFLDGECD